MRYSSGRGSSTIPLTWRMSFTSPRQRAVVTLEMLLGPAHKEHLEREDRVTVTENISEWEYGNAERLKPLEIKGVELIEDC